MATLTIRNLDETIKQRLREQAARHGHSMEEEARSILRKAVGGMTGADMLAISEELFGPDHGVELKIERWRGERPPPDFSGPEFDPDQA